MVGKQVLAVKIKTGKYAKQVLEAKNAMTQYNSVVGKKGRFVIVRMDEAKKGKPLVHVYNYLRAPFIYIMALLFFLSLILVGRKKGFMSGLGLIYTFLCVFTMFLPLVLRGYSPVLSAILLVIVVSTVTMILLNGVTVKSLCCILGTVFGVILASLVMMFFSAVMHISGYSLGEAEGLIHIGHTTGLKVEGLLYSGILIASLGAIMDVAMSIVSSVNEVLVHKKDSTPAVLFKAGMNVGKDLIGTMANTLILAFTGTSLELMIFISSYSVQYNQFINMNKTAIEITQALAGSFALVLTVPVSAFLASRLLTHRVGE
nr:YibE/F family protein [uncultured Desulfobacter sp.]